MWATGPVGCAGSQDRKHPPKSDRIPLGPDGSSTIASHRGHDEALGCGYHVCVLRTTQKNRCMRSGLEIW